MIKAVIIFVTMILCFPLTVFSDEKITPSKGGILKPLTLNTQTYKDSDLYHFKSDFYLSFNHFRGKTKEDYGLKFVILKKDGDTYSSKYESKGSGDSYSLKPAFYSHTSSKMPLLILAETGAEYSWGIRVFLLTNLSQAKDLGTLNVAVKPKLDILDNPESAIPYTRIVESNGKYVFTFTKDIIFDPGGRNEKTIQHSEIKYIYNGKSLDLITNHK